MTSPYSGRPQNEWGKITKDLVKKHPLSTEEVRIAAESAWSLVWKTRVGEPPTAIPFRELDPPAQIVGHFFEKLLARVLATEFPGTWAGPVDKTDKDLVYRPDPSYSIEIKSSGQLGLKIFGNRSYAQAGSVGSRASKPAKSGYFLTANFFGQTLMLLRFGWIDHADWQAQKSATGQMAGLPPEVYAHKLIPIEGDYRLAAPINIVDGIGDKSAEELRNVGISTIRDLLSFNGDNKRILRFKEAAARAYQVR